MKYFIITILYKSFYDNKYFFEYAKSDTIFCLTEGNNVNFDGYLATSLPIWVLKFVKCYNCPIKNF